MAAGEPFETIEFLRRDGESIVARFMRAHRDAVHAELRFEVVAHRSASAVNGEPRNSDQSDTAAFGVTVHVAGRGGADGAGHSGAEIGRLALSRQRLADALARGLDGAYQRARASARERAALLAAISARGLLCELPPPAPRVRDHVAARFRRDPGTIEIDALKRIAHESSKAVSGLGRDLAYNWVGAMTELRHELFVSSAGSVISQAFAFSQGDCYVVAQTADGHQETYDTIGQQRGFECLAEGFRGELMPNPDLPTFCVELARETRELAAAPALKPPQGEVVVVTDPHFNALLAHEIVGHPSEADRALKMEAAYAGRSWFLRSRDDTELGRQVGSPLLSACSDPSLDAYGHYRYDHEGTPGRRVMHIDRGRFAGFLNSRFTAAVLGAAPNGSARASEAWHVPLIRMSNTFFLPGESAPEKIIGEVEHGYFVAGNHVPSIAESRENFRISARRVYEIEHGRLGRLYRAGSVMADSKAFFMNVDAVGSDLRLIAIPNCGKGQPMQVKRMSNGGPTLRSRARLGGGT
jgi:TldD protein